MLHDYWFAADHLVPLAGTQAWHDFAATMYDEYAQLCADRIRALPELGKVEGVVVTGGLAFNTFLNTLIRRKLQMPVHVPLLGGDAGLPIGCLLHQFQPNIRQELMYSGAPLIDADEEAALATEFRAQPHTPDVIAELLSRGAVVAVLRGRHEIGIRALGHRALLMAPHAQGSRERLNQLKGRPLWLPVGGVVPSATFAHFSGDNKSLYPTFINNLRPELKHKLPGLWHGGTARLQALKPQQDPWLHAVLEAVGARLSMPVLAIANFKRTPYYPPVNRIYDALVELQSEASLDYVVVNDHLFSKKGVGSERLPAREVPSQDFQIDPSPKRHRGHRPMRQ